jgi:hypothetical protein
VRFKRAELIMSNDLSVVGFGQCGCSVAFEISGSFEPTAVFRFEPPASLSFKAIFKWAKTYDAGRTRAIDNKPKIYIGDLNSKNNVYLEQRKLQSAREIISRNKDLNDTQILEEVRHDLLP